MPQKKLEQVIQSQPGSDGDGVRINRIAGQHLNSRLDPFLMLDEIRSDDSADYIGGFPPHPHRGFETITYMIEGKLRHTDHMGNEGVIESGDVQWMTAARGVIHSEMPEQEDGLMHGFQAWLNLPADEKMNDPTYRDIRSKEVPELTTSGGALVRAIAGQVEVDGATVTGVVNGITTEAVYLDVFLPAEAELAIGFPEEHRALVFVFEGHTTELKNRHMGAYGKGDLLQLKSGGQPARLLVLAGKPLAEPVVQYGPFVMNTTAEIQQAIQDYQTGRLTE
jgi:redox-sensitive bicupin YhaK (pirin superfamily)